MKRPTFRRISTAVLVALLPWAALPAQPPQRSEEVIVYGNDPCPKSSGDEIVVCARRPEADRYRIPKALREDKARRTQTSWAARAAELDEANRAARPDSCSPVGSFGQTGCAAQALRQWRAERRAMRAPGAP